MSSIFGITIQSVFLQNTLGMLRRAVEIGGLDKVVYDYLSRPMRVIAVSIPVRVNGSLVMFEGYRVQHNNALGPFKGGIRFHPEVTLEDDIALATLMTLKNSLAGIPYGGAKGAVRVDPKRLSPRELEELSRGYVRAIAPLIGDVVDIPAPDVGTNSQIMAWMMDEYSKLRGYNVPGAFTSKPPELWGNPVREYATGFGVAVVAREASKRLWGGGLEGKTVAVQGMGNVGRWVTYWVTKLGGKVVAVSDINGVIYKKEGLNVDLIPENKMLNGPSLVEMFASKDGAEFIKNPDAIFTVKADILIPAAIENAIRLDNVDAIKARLIVEGANGPTTPEAEEYLTKRGVVIIPDILANAGGVIMSYLEWVENLQWMTWSEEETRSKLEGIMVNNFKKVLDEYDRIKKDGVTIRDAAIITAITRIEKAMKLRGWI